MRRELSEDYLRRLRVSGLLVGGWLAALGLLVAFREKKWRIR